MDKEKLKRVAIITDCNGKCKYVGSIKLVDENELHRLINESNEIDEQSKNKKFEIYEDIKFLKKENEKLKADIKKLKGEE